MAGINIWRDANPDMTPGLKKITLAEAKPGDALFFEGHMAVYLGCNSFIHSSSGTAKVTIASFDPKALNYSEWCAQNLICAGTVF
jgi:beta-lactamase class A